MLPANDNRRWQMQCFIFVGLTLAVAIANVNVTANTLKPDLLQSPVTPTGVFSTKPEISDYESNGLYEDFDSYVPYRSDSLDQFSWSLFKTVLRETSANAIFSPFSIKMSLALLCEAAGNNSQTQKQLMSTFSEIRTRDNLRGFYKKELSALKVDNPYYTLNLETKLYADEFLEPQQKYAAILQSFYYTEIESLKFADALAAAHNINSWSNNVTNGKLQQLVTANDVQGNVILLANVLYFKGLWRRHFTNVFEGVFFRSATEQRKAQYMEQTEYFYYFESKALNTKILRLPYKGKKFSMFILLPVNVGGIDELIQNLQNEQFKQMQWMMDNVQVKVTIPKFKFDFTKNLKETLIRLGIVDIFTNDASLPGLARGSDVSGKLRVSNIFQKAGIEVNERGTEAYAATVVEIENKFGGSNVIQEFNVNRPFLFIIEEESTGNILFAGKVNEPFV